MMTIMAMTTGELNFLDLFFPEYDVEMPPFYAITCVLFVVFLGIMTISIMNFLVGITLGDINELRDQSEVIAFNTLVDLTKENQAIYNLCVRLRDRC